MQDEDIDLLESPEITPKMFARAVVKRGLQAAKKKSSLTIRLDAEVLEWFRQSGKGYQTTINSLLRAYMEERKVAPRRKAAVRG